jgi:predicted O-linked N-acetylglucosamine transferase (SPINDLY family)
MLYSNFPVHLDKNHGRVVHMVVKRDRSSTTGDERVQKEPTASVGAPGQSVINELLSLYRRGKLTVVVETGEKLSREFPTSAALWNILGAANAGLKRWGEAERGFKEAAKIDPNHIDAYINLGFILGEQGKLDESVEYYRRALAIKPDYPEIHFSIGVTLNEQGRLDEAMESYWCALAIKPDYSEAYCNLGVMLGKQGKLDEAVESYQRALAINPDDAETLCNLGVALGKQGKLDEAVNSYQRSLSINPENAEVYYNLGSALSEQGKLDEAVGSYRRALAINPNFAEAHHNLGAALGEQGKPDEAVASYRRALAIDTDNSEALAQKFHQQALMCDWSDAAEFKPIVETLGIAGEPVTPFSLFSCDDNALRQCRRSENYARKKFQRQSTSPLPRLAAKPGKLRIGYFSSDFYGHAVLYLMLGVLRLHDKKRFEIFAYSHGPAKQDKMRDRVLEYVDCFSDIRDLPVLDVIKLARGHRLDIAVDLNGYTQHARPHYFSHRLAPIQINYLGYPGTMGADFMDYIVADRVVIPDEQRKHYSESVIYLPHSYQPNDNSREIADTSTKRGDFGLPEDGFVFCCFNNSYKITPREFDIWIRLLRKVEGGVLWLLRANRWVEANLRKEATARGVSAERLIFADKLPHAEHLARHRHADLFVDTFNYNAHTTASDALWATLPVVTKAGEQFASRVAASLLQAIGLPELVAATEADYEAMILRLATNKDALSAIKRKLANNRLTTPLFDTERYTRHLEEGYRQAYRRYFDGEAPGDLFIDA